MLLPPFSFSFGLGISFGGLPGTGAGVTGAAPAGRGVAQPSRWAAPHVSQHGPCDFFDPHRDFYLAKPHLGPWQPPSRIQFGLHGRPYFQQGPYDNPNRIMRTLDRSVGPGNYGFTANITTSSDPR